MLDMRIEVAKARRKCRRCGGFIPKHHTALVRWEPKTLPDRTVMEKANYCSKCGLEILDETIAYMRSNLGSLADLRVRCQMDYVPEDYRRSIHYIQGVGSDTRHILKGRGTEKTLCGRSITGGFDTGWTSPSQMANGHGVCLSCRRRWSAGRKAT